MSAKAAAKGNCEYCGDEDVMVSLVRGDLMCEGCIAKESAVTVSKAVIEDSRRKDDRVQLKSDVMQAATTSFIELQGAIFNNPDIAEERRRYALAEEATERIRKYDAAIFAHEEAGIIMKNERLAWLRNTQQLVATLRADEQAKFKNLNLNYKPQTPTVTKIKKVTKTPTPKVNGSRKYTPNQVKEACEKFGADRAVVGSMLLSSKNAGLTLEEVIQKYIARSKD